MHLPPPSKRYFRIFSQFFLRDASGYWSNDEPLSFRLITVACSERDFRLLWYRQVNKFRISKINPLVRRYAVAITNSVYNEYRNVQELQCVVTAFNGES